MASMKTKTEDGQSATSNQQDGMDADLYDMGLAFRILGRWA